MSHAGCGSTTARRRREPARRAWPLSRLSCPLMAATPTHVSLAAGVVVDVHETLAIAERAGANTGDCRDWELERIVVAGDVLPDRYDEWTVFERERFRQTRLQARESLCDDLRRQTRYDKGLDVGLAAIASEPP